MNIIGRLKQYYSKVMDIPDAPVKVARGAALGVAIDFLPLPLISIPIAFVVARVVGGNGVAAALTAAFFKWAVPFFYVLNITTGSFVLGLDQLEMAQPVMNSTSLNPTEWMGYLTQFGYPFLAGSLINAVLAWLVLYFVVRRLMALRQQRKGII